MKYAIKLGEKKETNKNTKRFYDFCKTRLA